RTPGQELPTYALPVRSPVSRPAAIATGGLSKGGRGHKSYEGGNQYSIEVPHTWSSTLQSVLLRFALHPLRRQVLHFELVRRAHGAIRSLYSDLHFALDF